ncbi:hypothetical protein CH063_14762, partial [Colletotrichum higginsianum]
THTHTHTHTLTHSHPSFSFSPSPYLFYLFALAIHPFAQALTQELCFSFSLEVPRPSCSDLTTIPTLTRLLHPVIQHLSLSLPLLLSTRVHITNCVHVVSAVTVRPHIICMYVHNIRTRAPFLRCWCCYSSKGGDDPDE